MYMTHCTICNQSDVCILWNEIENLKKTISSLANASHDLLISFTLRLFNSPVVTSPSMFQVLLQINNYRQQTETKVLQQHQQYVLAIYNQLLDKAFQEVDVRKCARHISAETDFVLQKTGMSMFCF